MKFYFRDELIMSTVHKFWTRKNSLFDKGSYRVSSTVVSNARRLVGETRASPILGNNEWGRFDLSWRRARKKETEARYTIWYCTFLKSGKIKVFDVRILKYLTHLIWSNLKLRQGHKYRRQQKQELQSSMLSFPDIDVYLICDWSELNALQLNENPKFRFYLET